MRWLKSTLVAAASWSVASAQLPEQEDPDFAPTPIEYAVDTLSRAPGCNIADFWRLARQLSPGTEIRYPNTTEFDAATERWSNVGGGVPYVDISVAPETEQDVMKLVRIANNCNVPFLAYNGRHGAITTLGQMNWGISIDLKKLSGVSISGNGQTATVLGGTNSKVLIDHLWAAGKQAVTGTCECVSYMGPALGGGHGWLQGHHGLIADQFVSAKIVTADGQLRTINSNSDLWWALKGAGHNFGIVTSVTIKIFPIVHTNWAITTLMYTGDKVEALYQAANDYLLQNGTQPVDIINWSYWMNIPPIDPTGPVVEFYIIQEGVTAVDTAYTAPFIALGPISVTNNTGTYKDVSSWVGISLDGPPCQKTGAANPRFPLYLPEYNPSAMAEVYEAFKEGTNSSSPFANSLFMFEGYSMQGVKAVDTASTAYAFREDNLLTAPLVQYTPGNAALDAQAQAFGNQLRNILHAGSGRSQKHIYLNYAYGDETKEEMYGHESWRSAKLLQLKDKYDSRRRFNFYGPAA
ncbi:hypothetical protein QC762_503630 [Podospora pseudocomata]|uniref:FAD-binding PCMH-type domain-containing protein n=1 Tax=Podospora pseudocomata TaxID=2093779 RepID=A0ABR0GBD4_9PEZI|nr:hypothetical protein QC762_503630 [Podospora pseudocomata]